MIHITGNKKLIALIVLFFGQTIISLSDININIERNTGVSGPSISHRLTNDVSSFDGVSSSESMIRTFMDEWGIVGASVAIAKDERLIYAKGFGFTDTTSKEIVQPRHLFRVASISKLITSVGIMKLIEEDKLELSSTVFGSKGIMDDTIYQDIKDPRVKKITVEHLLQHSAGWSKYSGDPVFMPYTIKNKMNVELPVSLETTIRYTLKYRSLDYNPGEESSYSNFGYAVLGKVIEEVSGLSYEQYITSELLNPLGIYNMRLGNSRLDGKFAEEVKYYSHSRFQRSYSSFNAGEIVPRQYGGNNLRVLGAAGAWLASPAEMLKLVAHIDGLESKEDILSDKSIAEMTNHDPDMNPMGWVSTNNNGTWKRTGTLTGTSAILKRYENGISWMIVLNTSNDRGHEFTDNLSSLMTQVVNSVHDWPEYDLFTYNPPKPLFTYSESGH